MIKYGIHRKHIGLSWLSFILAMCVSLSACGESDTAGGNLSDNNSGENNAAGSAQRREWVYVPEIIAVEDEYADYERMQLIGDDFCYVSQGGRC